MHYVEVLLCIQHGGAMYTFVNSWHSASDGAYLPKHCAQQDKIGELSKCFVSRRDEATLLPQCFVVISDRPI